MGPASSLEDFEKWLQEQADPKPEPAAGAGQESTPRILIIDGYEHIRVPTADAHVLRTVRNHPQLHMVVVGRNLGTLPFTFPGSIEVTYLSREDFALTALDAQELAGESLTEHAGELTAAIAASAGWPRAARTLADPLLRDIALSYRTNHMLEGLFEAITDPLERQILYAVASRPRVSPGTLGAVLDRDEGEIIEVADKLTQKGLVLAERGIGGVAFSCPGTFAKSILVTSPKWLTDRQVKEISVLNAKEIAHFAPIEALATFLEYGEYDLATRLLVRQVSRITGLEAAFLPLLGQVPPRVFQKHPRLMGLRFLSERRTLSGPPTLV